MSDYLPLYAEKRCLVCGFWRGQHIGLSADDVEMRCPTTFKSVSAEAVAQDEAAEVFRWMVGRSKILSFLLGTPGNEVQAK